MSSYATETEVGTSDGIGSGYSSTIQHPGQSEFNSTTCPT